MTGCRVFTTSVEDKSSEGLERNEQEGGEEVSIMVGKKAPDFEAPAYYKGDFTTVRLWNFADKWVMLCFYPGDFTFV